MKSDGRRYKVNVQTDSIVETDIHQHRLHTRHHRIDPKTISSNPDGNDGKIPPALSDIPPESTIMSSKNSTTGWETILLPLNSFVRTNFGLVTEPQTSLLQHRVRSVGIGLTDRVEGPFDLRVHRIWATNGLSAEEGEEERWICGENALSVGEGLPRQVAMKEIIESGTQVKQQEKEEEKEEEEDEEVSNVGKPKGLQGLRSRWDE